MPSGPALGALPPTLRASIAQADFAHDRLVWKIVDEDIDVVIALDGAPERHVPHAIRTHIGEIHHRQRKARPRGPGKCWEEMPKEG